MKSFPVAACGLFASVICSFCCSSTLFADPGHPVAIRQWQPGVFSIETMWNLNLLVDLSSNAADAQKAEADQVVGSTAVHHVLHRTANEVDVRWQEWSKSSSQLPNAISVKSHADKDGSASGSAFVQVQVDGVHLVFLNADQITSDSTEAILSLTDVDVVALSTPENSAVDADTLNQLITKLDPQILLLDLPDQAIASVLKTLSRQDVPTSSHNTLAVSSSDVGTDQLQVVRLARESQPMPKALQDLFERMEASCQGSQEIFAKLSIEQMNFQPSNGTHTPRWNTEHMMGRQLLFFSQIYNKLDPAIPAMNLNPKQMPKDYTFAHEDWTGAEEARQMERVSRFTRRFAYLIHDLDVEQRAPGSRWPSLKALLLQMERHYSEHTANTVKKFDLPDWPQK